MQASEIERAIAAAKSIAAGCNLAAQDVRIVNDSNKLSLRLSPCNTFARVAHVGREVARFEIEIARRLAETEDCPVAALDSRVAPRVYQRDGFAVTFWQDHGPQAHGDVSPADYAVALQGLHAGMRRVAVTAPRFTDRIAEAQHLVSGVDRTPALSTGDRELLTDTLAGLRRSITAREAAEQLLHGEPHPNNLLSTKTGLLFVDFETCCQGPVEFDLAHAPEEVSDHYPGVDRSLLGECRGLVLAMVAAWRWDPDDDFPNGRRAGQTLLEAVRNGPPWPSLDTAMRA